MRIAITTEGGPVDVSAAYVAGEWAVTPRLEAITGLEATTVLEDGDWMVTHVPSGRRVGAGVSYASAVRIVDLLAARGVVVARDRWGVVTGALREDILACISEGEVEP